MQRSQVLIGCLLVILLAGCTAPTNEKRYSHEDWAEAQHPPSDKRPLPDGCLPLRYLGGFHPIREAVAGSGQHCVVHDFVQRRRIDVIDRSERGSPKYDGVLRFFRGSYVNLDLRGHLISGAPFDDTIGIEGSNEELTDLRVFNGRITTPGKLGVGVYMAPYKYTGFATEPKPEDEAPMRQRRVDFATKADINFDPWDYNPPTRYTAENLHITSGGRGIIMSGADNAIRNNVIEVDGQTAVYMYGPRPVIEGNTFIVHLDADDKAPLPAILKLRDADGAIIRNNRFVVQSRRLFTRKAEAAINLLASKDVRIEDNTVQDVKLFVRKDASSTTVEKGNSVR